MVNYAKVYSKQVARRYRTKQRFRQKKKMGRYGNINLGKVASDLNKVKKMLNTEHKMVATNYGTTGVTGNPSIQFNPANRIEFTRSTPTFIRIGYPLKGTNSYNRVGNSIKVISISAKINTSFLFPSVGASGAVSSARLLNPYVDVYLMLRKSSSTQAGTALPTIGELFYPDSNGGYNSQCFRRKETLNQYVVLGKKRISAICDTSLLSGETNIGFAKERYCTIASRKPLYFKWTPGSTNSGVEGSYTDCQSGLLFMLFMTNTLTKETDNTGLTSAETYAQIQMTYVDN
jgi:hypothetical protein